MVIVQALVVLLIVGCSFAQLQSQCFPLDLKRQSTNNYAVHVPYYFLASRTMSILATPTANKFTLRFCSSDCTATIPFLFDVRFSENAVVRNSKRNGAWDREERGGGMPFAKGRRFNLTMIFEPHRVQVFVDGSFFCNFNVRTSLETLGRLEFQNMKDYSLVCSALPETCPWTMTRIGNGYKTSSVPASYLYGRKMSIYGTSVGSRTTVNFNKDNAILFSFGVRFDQRVVVRNSKSGYYWGTEERDRGFPFHQVDDPFTIDMLFGGDEIEISVNGVRFCTWDYRVTGMSTVDSIDFLNMNVDDVTCETVYVL